MFLSGQGRLPTSRGRNCRPARPKIGVTPQRCLLPPIPSRATASTQADLPMQPKCLFVTLGPMSTTALNKRHPRGVNPKERHLQQLPRKNGFRLPEYLEMVEVNALIAAAPNPRARLIMLEQWRAGLRVSEALALGIRDLHLDSDRPTLVVRRGKGRKPRVVPVHPELQTALTAPTSSGTVGQGRLIGVSRVTVWRWVQQAVLRATEAGQIPQGRSVGTHALRHSFARHMLLNGIPLNYLSRWLGHGRIQTTLVYMELVPDPSGSPVSVP